MTWGERLITLVFLLLAWLVGYRYGEHEMLVMLGLGTFIGIAALLEEVRAEIRSIKTFLREKEPKGA
jgi:hypothetical protein